MDEPGKSVDNLLKETESQTQSQLFLSKIEEKLGTQAFQTWFSSASIRISDEENGALLTLPNTFIADFVEQNYADLLRNTAYELTRRNLDLRILIQHSDEDRKIVEKISTEIETVQRKRQAPSEARLVPEFTFDNFVTGSNNEFAYTSALAVAEAPGRTQFNPLFIYGKTGLGKTHLLQAIGHFALTEETADRVLYVTGNQFLVDFMHYLDNNKKSQDFHKRFENTDILLIDDIQFLRGKETQIQFSFIFEALTAQKKQIVITSDRHPDELKEMKVRLLNRFSGGLLVDIQPPAFETKIAILKKKAEQNGISLPPEVLETLADSPTQNVRELDGLLIKIIAYSNFTGHDITQDLIRQVLGEAVSTMNSPVTMDAILTETAREFDVSKNKLCALSRAREVAIPRQICMYLCKKLTPNSLATIGVTFNRNHSTVIHSIKKCEEWITAIDPLAHRIKNIEKRLKPS